MPPVLVLHRRRQVGNTASHLQSQLYRERSEGHRCTRLECAHCPPRAQVPASVPRPARPSALSRPGAALLPLVPVTGALSGWQASSLDEARLLLWTAVGGVHSAAAGKTSWDTHCPSLGHVGTAKLLFRPEPLCHARRCPHALPALPGACRSLAS